MPDLTPIQPVASIIGAIITAAAASLVTYFVVTKRKVIKFWIGESEDITAPLKKEHPAIVFKVGERELPNLNRATIAAKNVGNTAVANLHFEINIEGDHQNAFFVITAKSPTLKEAIKGSSSNGAFHVDTPYFNPHEMFEVVIYFDGPVSKCMAECRMEDIRVKMTKGEYVSLKDILRETLSDPLRRLPFVVAVLTAALVTASVLRGLAKIFPFAR